MNKRRIRKETIAKEGERRKGGRTENTEEKENKGLGAEGKVEVKVKSLNLPKYHTMKTYGGVEVQVHASLTSALNGGEWSASASTPGKGSPVPIGLGTGAGWTR
jgi:hypothetical protein